MEPKPITTWSATRAFFTGGCSGGAIRELNRAFGQAMDAEERAVSPLMGGLKMQGYQCGALWGAALAAGAQAHRVMGPGPQAEAAALYLCQQLASGFLERSGSIDCDDLNDLEMKRMNPMGIFAHFFLKGGTVRCLKLCTGWSKLALETIQEGIEEPASEPPQAPVSCAAELARRVGATEQQVCMAAGLAGGIGLSGDACGALGAAVWLLAMRVSEEHEVADVWDHEVFESRFEAMMARYLEAAEYNMECNEVVGRRFEDVHDHAVWVQGGGCSAIIDALAEGVTTPPTPPTP
jgi:hypothetical protein